MLNDLRVALRSLRTHPAFAAVTVLTLALGIGANTMMFSVVYGVLLRPLPYPASERIVELAQTYQGTRDVMAVDNREFQFLDRHRDVFQSLAATTPLGFNLFAGDVAERVNGLRVSRDYFRVLGVPPQIGRTFTMGEDQPAGPAVVMLSHGLWIAAIGGRSARSGADAATGRRTVHGGGRHAGELQRGARSRSLVDARAGREHGWEWRELRGPGSARPRAHPGAGAGAYAEHDRGVP